MQPIDRSLGDQRADDGIRRGNHTSAGQGEVLRNPSIISENGPQFIARNFKEYIRISGMTHVRTSPYYPQSNGKTDRFHQTIKDECIRPGVQLSLDNAGSIIGRYTDNYNAVRLHSAIGNVSSADKLSGRD